MPSASYVEIPAGHLPQYERPDLTNEAILRFLERIIPRSLPHQGEAAQMLQ